MAPEETLLLPPRAPHLFFNGHCPGVAEGQVLPCDLLDVVLEGQNHRIRVRSFPRYGHLL